MSCFQNSGLGKRKISQDPQGGRYLHGSRVLPHEGVRDTGANARTDATIIWVSQDLRG